MDKEIWKDIPGYEGLYQISNTGKIKSLEFYKKNEFKKYKTKERILSQHINDKGYYCVDLYKDGKRKKFKSHRLVLLSFLGESSLIINHINGIKTDNRVENLEYCTYSHNLKHAYDTNLRNKYHRNNNKAVDQYDLNGIFISEWESIKLAQDELKIHGITRVCKNKGKSAGGFIWRYKKTTE
jgi:hypothetical protein